ncbi:hypothetical protein AB833_02600 [Chromatiales bacterium (ex Bugula neritina AB1)]|nr:hypothetical protein AB833_02600 [Chromatiales bacterium (ex Bugula neritina AB1)]
MAFEGSGRCIEGPGSEAFGPDRVYDYDRWSAMFSCMTSLLKCDASVSTITYPETSIPNIEKYCGGDVKIIVMLRDPIERAYSSYLYNSSRGWNAGTFEQGLDLERHRRVEGWSHLWFYEYLSQYENRIEPFIESFGRSSIHFVLMEEFTKKPSLCLTKCFEFLGVQNVRIDTSSSVNVGGKPKSEYLAVAMNRLRRYPLVVNAIKKVTSSSMRETVRGYNLERQAPPTYVFDRLSPELLGTYEWAGDLCSEVSEYWRNPCKC